MSGFTTRFDDHDPLSSPLAAVVDDCKCTKQGSAFVEDFFQWLEAWVSLIEHASSRVLGGGMTLVG